MSMDPMWLFLSLIPGGIGFVLLVYGKKQGRWPHIVGGLLFMAYPYFATTVMSLLIGGVALSVATWYAASMW
jgi:hypothetical protein